MSLYRTIFAFPVALIVVTSAGCAAESGEPTESGSASQTKAGEVSTYKCVLEMSEEVPLRTVDYSIKPDQDVDCDAIPADQITSTKTFNELPRGSTERCASEGQSGPEGGSGQAFYVYTAKTARQEFELKTECARGIPGDACLATLSGPDVDGPLMMINGTSSDKSESGSFIHITGALSTRLDTDKGTLQLNVLAARSSINMTSGIQNERDGKAEGTFTVGAPQLHLAVSFVGKDVNGFGLDSAAELDCEKTR
jgi:hypothetical protein